MFFVISLLSQFARYTELAEPIDADLYRRICQVCTICLLLSQNALIFVMYFDLRWTICDGLLYASSRDMNFFESLVNFKRNYDFFIS